MPKQVTANTFFTEYNDRVIFDVRTPAEFETAHIPHSINLPLFSNEERAVVGTLYKQQNPEVAFIKGLDFAGARMSNYVRQAIEKAPNRKIALYCWRGGKRSGSMAWLLEFAGFDVIVLKGGYKAYRKYVREEFDWKQLPLIVLGGKTGSGKTAILEQLKAKGEQVVDLESIANHKGSSFGMLGQLPQPSTDHFDNELHECVRQFDFTKRIWVENESRSIGSVYLLDGFWQQLASAPLIILEVPQHTRINRLVEEYANFKISDLEAAFQRIKKRLGGQKLKEALAALEQREFEKAAEIALYYYDKSYEKSSQKKAFEQKIAFKTDLEEAELICEKLIILADEQGI